MFRKCWRGATSSLDLHMLIVPYWYLFRTLLVPKVALGSDPRGASSCSSKLQQLTPLKELTPLVTSHGHAALRLAGSAPDGKLVDTLNALTARLNDLEAKARSTETDVATSRTRDSTTS